MSTKHAIVKQVQGTTLVARADSTHWVVMDGSPVYGGSSAGSSPKELLLMALGGCTAMDVIPMLRKKRVPVDSVEVHLSGNVREEHPQIFTSIHIEYVVHGHDIDTHDVEHAIELSTTKYCAVSAMLSGNVTITHSYKIADGSVAAVQELAAVQN